MTVDNKTPHQQYPLPHPTNQLDQDVLRLAEALKAVDSNVYALLQADKSANEARETLKKALEENDKTLDAKLTTLEDKHETQVEASTKQARKHKLNQLLGESIFPL
ncbi:hypothetical protein BGP78_06385 [Pseudoalteromonas sp. MSK9-3]|uniref:hypothetical protein n=1 Tax=Pseudoalteromonas sp. MSK9-3 TaxID=1897633 RepID=UPI000E6B5B12|nr:hypothetical protein [Pseudoalteromonas sp. MSK9-3]RJE78135.1 hypothetical protein BGP78_06385 [Pseudoalteromonas sp. MSK9-3]